MAKAFFLLKHFAHRIPRAARLSILSFWTLLAAHAGPLGFEDWFQLAPSEKVADCGICGFITTYEPVEPPTDFEQMLAALGFITSLVVVGLVGIRFRVRAAASGPRPKGYLPAPKTVHRRRDQ